MPTNRRERAQGRHSSKWWFALTAAGVALLFIAAAVLIDLPLGEERPEGATSTNAVSHTPDTPLVVQERSRLTVPYTENMKSQKFDAKSGRWYLLKFEATTSKPEGSPGDAMYFGAGLACGGPDGGTMRSIGGTQNVRTGETVTIRNQFLLEIEESGTHSCRLSLNSPNADAAAKETSVEVISQWSATRLEAPAFEAEGSKRLPRIINPGERAAAFRFTVNLADVPSRRLDLLSTLHLTTCTGTNGSREDGKTWCLGDDVDLEGSSLRVEYREDVLGADGKVCETRMLSARPIEIVRYTHHQVLSFEQNPDEPLDACGETVRYVVAVENDGPAPVLVHRSNSTLLLLASA